MNNEKQNIGRNAPCPCGSGKKYKKCCYPDKTKAWKTAGSYETPIFTVKPTGIPQPIMHHLISSNGGKTWMPKPGLLAVRLHGKEPKNIDEAVGKLSGSVQSKINILNLPQNIKQEIVGRLKDLDHKLHAVNYHLNNYEQAEKEKLKEFNKDYKPPAGAQLTFEEPKLLYEVEAFLFQTKSCLDILSWILKPTFGFNYCSFGDKGDDIVKQLRNNCPTKLDQYAKNIIKLIEDAQEDWIVELIKMRDENTHYSKLEGFNCFIEDPYVGGDIANIHYPTMPNNRGALKYCQNVWQKLLIFCENFFSFAIEAAIVRVAHSI